MYPLDILNLFPPFGRTNQVFVAMSFDTRFDPIWENVFVPAIGAVALENGHLTAHRVDMTRKGDSILTEVVRSIAEARLVLADVSTTGWQVLEAERSRPIRNGNVLYEIGMAHAARLPEEVIVVRSDSDHLDFDIAGVRIHQYPAESLAASELIGSLIADALKAVDQRRSIAVQKALQSLDPQMFLILQEFNDVPHPNLTTMGQILASIERLGAIQRLLSGGMLQAILTPLKEDFMNRPVADLMSYRKTPFGIQVWAAARQQLGYADAVQKWLQTDAGKAWIADKSRTVGQHEPGV
jgi:hypothetical protein